jgi:hypothetical protein
VGRSLAGALLACFAGALGTAIGIPAPRAAAETPTVYKWIDEHGVAHYTTDRGRIPSSIRNRVEQRGAASRGADWLTRDAGAAPPPLPTAAAPEAGATAPAPTPGARATAARETSGVEPPEQSDGVHAVPAEGDWSAAPGAEAAYAPGDLGDAESARNAAAAKPDSAERPVSTTTAVPTSSVADPDATPLEADGAPVEAAAPAAVRPADAPSPSEPIETAVPVDPTPVETAPEPEPPTVVATPAPAPPEPVEPTEPDSSWSSEPAEPDDPEGQALRALPPPEPVAAATPAEPVAPAPPAEPAPEEPPAPAAVAAPAPGTDVHDLDARIAALEQEIARDEETLMTLISETEGERTSPLADDPAFREIAQRLPKKQAELETLRAQRGGSEPSSARP